MSRSNSSKTRRGVKSARRRPAPQPFYETLVRSGQPVLPWGMPVLWDWEQLRRALGLWSRRLGRISLKTLRTLTGHWARRIYLVIIAGSLAAGIGAAAALASSTLSTFAHDLSNPAVIINKKNTGTTILDRHGQVLYQVYGATNRQPVELGQLPRNLINATLAAEDPHFYDHPGFSWQATARAVLTDLIHRNKVEGGSTITQQLVKNSLLSSDKSFIRKFQEILLSGALEQRYSKDQILQMYLNDIYYGQGAYGVGTAAQSYFHKDAKDLDLAQAALLAGLPLAPSQFDPTLDVAAATARRAFILNRMSELHFITPAQARVAATEPIGASSRQITLKAPHFVFYVLAALRQQYGDDLVEHGGITVTTTLDLSKQAIAETVVRAQIEREGYHHIGNAGLISLDPATGEILAMVGSVDYNQPQFGNVNVTLSQLQPGSSFKPFAYATAFTKGWNGATLVPDLPASFPGGDGSVYRPTDYDGKWRGPITLRRALANSFNMPAIHVLQFAGIHDTIATAHALGITTLNDESRYGLALVLGGGEVRPLDMAAAYGVFASGGVKHSPISLRKLTDRYGAEIKIPTTPAAPSVLDPRIAYMITSILSDNGARTEEFGPNSPLKLSRPAAVKTGTTDDFRDDWTVGYTPDLVTAVWAGNNDHTPMLGVNGVTGAAPIWHSYMEQALAGTPAHDFTRPAGLVNAVICNADGGLANPWDHALTNELFLAGATPTKHCGSSNPNPVPESSGDQATNQDNGVQPGPTPKPDPIPTPPPQPQPPPKPCRHDNFCPPPRT